MTASHGIEAVTSEADFSGDRHHAGVVVGSNSIDGGDGSDFGKKGHLQPGMFENRLQAGPPASLGLEAFSDQVLTLGRQPCAESKFSSANLLIGFKRNITAHHVVQ